MRRLGPWSVALGLALALPAPALGQAVKPATLVSTWVHRRDGGELFDSLKGQLVVTYLKIDPQGTFAYEGKIKKEDGEWRAYGIGWPKGSWALVADTLRFTDTRSSSTSYKVVVKDGQLLLWDWLMWEADRRDAKCAAKVFERFDPSRPLTLPPLPQVTIRPADLVGTWVGKFKTKLWGMAIDTLFFDGKSNIMRWMHYGWPDLSPRTFGWDSLPGPEFTGVWPGRMEGSASPVLLPGDKLTGSRIFGTYPIVLRDGKLIPCSPIRPIMERVRP